MSAISRARGRKVRRKRIGPALELDMRLHTLRLLFPYPLPTPKRGKKAKP